MLEKSINIKLQAKRKEFIEEMENEMKLTGFRMKERVNRVINKIFDQEIEFDDIFLPKPEELEAKQREGQSEIEDDCHRLTLKHLMKRSMGSIE